MKTRGLARQRRAIPSKIEGKESEFVASVGLMSNLLRIGCLRSSAGRILAGRGEMSRKS